MTRADVNMKYWKRKLVIEFTPLVLFLVMNNLYTFRYSDLTGLFNYRYVHRFVLKGKAFGIIERVGQKTYRISENFFETVVITRNGYYDDNAENILIKGGWTFIFNPKSVKSEYNEVL
ncbi:hypothetical protein [Geoglobus acetivorans]|uniref:hypothetical protein n=1 Tax=Geoglobus acetivorans TaxID=565033 RepID=UPI00064FF68C